MTYSIYTLNDENGNVFYVGQSKNPTKRFKRHINASKWENIFPVHRKLRKVLAMGVNPNSILKIIEYGIPMKNADNREMFYIKHFKELGIKLKNLTDGGDGFKGITPEIIEKIASKNRGQKRTPDQIKRVSESLKGKAFTEKHKRALKKAWKSRPPMPSDWGAQMSERNRGKVNIKRFLVSSKNGETFITEHGLTEFCRQHELTTGNLYRTLNGTRAHHKGWRIIKNLG